jgi:hypothetical protein
MPAFASAYSDAKIATIVNYVIGRFGAIASAITPDEIAKQWQDQ